MVHMELRRLFMKIYIFEISRTHYYGEACRNLTWYFPSSIRMPKRSGAVGDSSNWVNYTDMTECVAPVALFGGFLSFYDASQEFKCGDVSIFAKVFYGLSMFLLSFSLGKITRNYVRILAWVRLIMTLNAVPCSSRTCLIFEDAQIKCY